MKTYARRGVTHKEELRMENHEVHREVTHGEELRMERSCKWRGLTLLQKISGTVGKDTLDLLQWRVRSLLDPQTNRIWVLNKAKGSKDNKIAKMRQNHNPSQPTAKKRDLLRIRP